MLIENNLSDEAKQAINEVCDTAKKYLESRRPNMFWNCANCSHFKPDDRLWLCDSARRWNKEEESRSNIGGLTICVDEGENCNYFGFKEPC
jgi:lipopolysaccharide biosynthesis regulator YciM